MPEMLLNSMIFCEMINTLQHNLDLQWAWDGQLLKTLYEKEKILIASILSFFYNVFYLSQNKFQVLSYI